MGRLYFLSKSSATLAKKVYSYRGSGCHGNEPFVWPWVTYILLFEQKFQLCSFFSKKARVMSDESRDRVSHAFCENLKWPPYPAASWILCFFFLPALMFMIKLARFHAAIKRCIVKTSYPDKVVIILTKYNLCHNYDYYLMTFELTQSWLLAICFYDAIKNKTKSRPTNHWPWTRTWILIRMVDTQ